MEEDDGSSPSRYRTSATSTGILLATSGPYVERIFQVGPAGGLIGRSRKCTISLLHDCEVSHNHALLELYHGHLCIRDVGSTFGTYLNDKRLSEPKRASEAHKLKPCDAIKVGQTSLRWRPLPVIRATLAVSVPASVRPLAEQCAALGEAATPGEVRREHGPLVQRALTWAAGLPAAAGSSAAALEHLSRSSLPSVDATTGYAHSSLGLYPNLNSTASFETLQAGGTLASPSVAGGGGEGGGGGAGGLEFFHRMGADETHQRLLLVLRTLYLRHQDSLTHLRKTAVPVDLPCVYRRLQLVQSVSSHAARHAASLRDTPARAPVGLTRAASIVAGVLSAASGAGAAGGAAAGAVSLEMYAAEPEVARLHELARELQLLRQDTLFYFEDALKTLAAFTHAQRYHARALQAEEVRGLLHAILVQGPPPPQPAADCASATSDPSVPDDAQRTGGTSDPPRGIKPPDDGMPEAGAVPPAVSFSAVARSAASLIHRWLAQADAASDRMLVTVFTCERWLGTAEALVRAPAEDRPSELPALMRQRRQLRSQLAALCAIPSAPAALVKASDTSAASLSAAASEAASPIAMRLIATAAPPPGVGLSSSLIQPAGPRADADWPLPSSGLLRLPTPAAAAAAARQRWETALRQLCLEREISRVDAQLERLLRRAPHAPTLEERVGLLPDLPPLVAELEAEAAAATESPQIDDGAGRCARRRIGAAALGLMAANGGGSACGAPVAGGGGGASPPNRQRQRLVCPCGPSCRGGPRRSLLHSLMLLDPGPAAAALGTACGAAAVDATEIDSLCAAECSYMGGPGQAATADAAAGGGGNAAAAAGPTDPFCCARHFAVAPTLLCYDPAGGYGGVATAVVGEVYGGGATSAAGGSWRVDAAAAHLRSSAGAPFPAFGGRPGGGAAPCSLDEAGRNGHGGACFTALLDAEPCALQVWRVGSAGAAAAGLAALRARAQCTGPSLLGVSYSWTEPATPETDSWLEQLYAAGGGAGGAGWSGGDGSADSASGGWLLCAQLGHEALGLPAGELPKLPAGALVKQCALQLVQALGDLHRRGLSCAGHITPSDVLAVAHPGAHLAQSPPTSPVAASAGSNDNTLSPNRDVTWNGGPGAAPTLSPLTPTRWPPTVSPPFSPAGTPHPSLLLLCCLRAAPAREGHFAADIASLGAVLRELCDASTTDAPPSCLSAAAACSAFQPHLADPSRPRSNPSAPAPHAPPLDPSTALDALILSMCDPCPGLRPPAAALASHPALHASAGPAAASSGSEAQAQAVWSAGWALRAEAAAQMPTLTVILPWGQDTGGVTDASAAVDGRDGDDAAGGRHAAPIQVRAGGHGGAAAGASTGWGAGVRSAKPADLVDVLLGLPSLLASAGAGATDATRPLAPFRPFTLVLDRPASEPDAPRREVSLASLMDAFWRRVLLHHSRTTTDAAAEELAFSAAEPPAATPNAAAAARAAAPTEPGGGGAPLLDLPPPTTALGPLAALPPPMPLPPCDDLYDDTWGGTAPDLGAALHRALDAQRDLGRLLFVCLASGVPLPPWLAPSTYRAILGHGLTSGLDDLAAARPQLATRYALFLASVGGEADWPDSELPPPPPVPRPFAPPATAPPAAAPASGVAAVDSGVNALEAGVNALRIGAAAEPAAAGVTRLEEHTCSAGDGTAPSVSGGGVMLSATSPKLLDVFRAVGWRLHGCRGKACDALASGFHTDTPVSIGTAIRAASCEGLVLAAAGCVPLPSSSLESRLVFESWPDGSLTPRLLCQLLRSETDMFRRRFLLLVTGRTTLPHPQLASWEGAAAARHTGSLSANGRRHHPGRGGGGLPRSAVAPGMLVIRYQVPPPGGPPPPRVLRSAWVVLLTEMPDAPTLRLAIAAALARSPEARWGDDDTWLVPLAPAERRRARQ